MDTNKLREIFKRDRFAALTGLQIDSMTAEEVVCSLRIDDRHLNAGDKAHGGVIFTLADFTFGVACNYDDLMANLDNASVSQSSNIVFLKTPVGERLIARSEILRQGRKISVYRIVVTDEQGTAVAEVTSTAYRITPEV